MAFFFLGSIWMWYHGVFTPNLEKVLVMFMLEQVAYLVGLFIIGIYLLNNKGHLEGLLLQEVQWGGVENGLT